MSTTRHGIHEDNDPVQEIRFPDFDISWVGEDPWLGGLWFGSEDGHLKRTDRHWVETLATHQVSMSGEAINGVAFSDRMMAVSTRSEVAFLSLDVRCPERRRTYPGGAHGVVATKAGRFLAPLGTGGLLLKTPQPSLIKLMNVSVPESGKIDLHKMTHLASDCRSDVVACAARRDGFLVLEMDGDEPVTSRIFSASGLDLVDVCSIGSPDCPRASAGLGADRSIHLSRDLLHDRPTWSLRFDRVQGSAYSILHARGHLFVLTSEAIYIYPDLASRFLADESKVGPTPIRMLPLQAVEIFVAHDQLLVLMPDHVMPMAIDLVAAKGVLRTPQLTEMSWDSSPISGLTFAGVA